MKYATSLTGAIRSEKYDVIIINFANPDMVGHTGDPGSSDHRQWKQSMNV